MNLKELSDKELKKHFQDVSKELNKRNIEEQAISSNKINKKWFYFYDQESADLNKEFNKNTNISKFLFVRKTFWNKHKCLEDGATCKHPIALPTNCSEYVEEGFEFQLPRNKAEKLLQEFGFTPINPPPTFFWLDSTN